MGGALGETNALSWSRIIIIMISYHDFYDADHNDDNDDDQDDGEDEAQHHLLGKRPMLPSLSIKVTMLFSLVDLMILMVILKTSDCNLFTMKLIFLRWGVLGFGESQFGWTNFGGKHNYGFERSFEA